MSIKKEYPYFFTTLFMLFSCVTPKPLPLKNYEVVKKSKSTVPALTIISDPEKESHCLRFKDKETKLPLWLKNQGYVVTRVLNECETSDGYKGYNDKSPWVAMGFPCTGGKGNIDIGGHYFAPKIVVFPLSTDCSMYPQTLAHVHDTGVKAMKLKNDAQLLAFNPFAVQYWEIPGLEDADVGFNIELRSVDAKQRVWRQFIDKKPIPINLYGRENAWMKGYHFFYVAGELIISGSKTFQLRIKHVQQLDEEEIKRIRQRCDALIPRRNCSSVFS